MEKTRVDLPACDRFYVKFANDNEFPVDLQNRMAANLGASRIEAVATGHLGMIAEYQQAQAGVSSALSRLLVTVERYPQLQANQNFLELQSQLEGTENRINVARDRFNTAVNEYNQHVRIFPNNLFAGMFGFEPMTRFEADAGAEQAPDVEFDFNN